MSGDMTGIWIDECCPPKNRHERRRLITLSRRSRKGVSNSKPFHKTKSNKFGGKLFKPKGGEKLGKDHKEKAGEEKSEGEEKDVLG